MRKWQQMAEGLGAGLSEADFEKITPVLEGLEAALRPLIDSLPIASEPAVFFDATTEPQS
jgi:hypothetical protein